VKEPVYRWFVPRFDGYLVVGARARNYLLHYGARPDRCFDVPHAVDNAFFASRAEEARHDRSEHRARFGLPDESVVFLFVGKLADDKNPEGFVRAVASAAARCTGVWGLVIGDGPLRAETERVAESLGAPVRFAGFQNQSQMGAAYAVGDVLVVTSRHETWGLVVNEAMACGLPALVSRGVGCAEDLILSGDTGEVFDVDDGERLASLIARLAADREERQRMSARAVEHVGRFDVSVAAASTVEAVHRVIDRR
jgi:glycosyltransferase involved in cell wall biosynthesis